MLALLPLLVAALAWAGVHALVSGTALRARLIAAVGEARYRGLFALLSLGTFVGIIWAYRAAPYVPVWAPPVGLRHLAALTMLVAFLLIVVGQMTPSPTVAGLTAKRLADPEPARGILRITRHPFLMAVAVWAATHLLVRGDAASMIFFAAFLYLGVTGPIRIDRRLAREFGAPWQRFAEVTSVAPFAAIAAGRNKLALGEIGLVRVAVAVATYVVSLLWLHKWLFGVAPLGH